MESNFISTMLLIMLSINVFLGMADFAMGSMNSDVSYFDFTKTPASNMTEGRVINSTLTADYGDAEVKLADSVDVGSGSSFTDSFRSTKGWWDKMDDSFGIATSILRQPAGFMKDIGLPSVIYVSFGAIWYGLGLIALIYLLTGRQ